MLEDKAARIKFYVQQSHPSEMKDESQYPLTFKERTIFHSWSVLQEIPKDSFRLKLKRLKQALGSNLIICIHIKMYFPRRVHGGKRHLDLPGKEQ